MTNAELIAKIKTEVERRKTIQLKRIQEGDMVDSAPYDKNEAYNELLSFLSTLESEKPVPKDLEEAAEDSWQNSPDKEIYDAYSPFYKDGFIAGAKWQAEQLLKSSPPPEHTALFNKGVEEGRRLEREENLDLDIVFWKGIQYAKEQMLKDGLDAVKTLDFNKAEKTIAGVFVKYGMDLQKEQMMKETVAGEVCGRVYDHINVRFADGVCKYLEPKNISHIPADVSKYKVGDKVRIIVCKNED